MEKQISIIDIIQSNEFKVILNNTLAEEKHKRDCRPNPEPGMKYRRTWYDTFSEKGILNADFFAQEVIKIMNKKSHLSKIERDVIMFFCDTAIKGFLKNPKVSESTKSKNVRSI